MKLKSLSPEETKKFASGLLGILKLPRKGAVVIALSGDLGAGKTTFVQGLAESLGADKRALSPTFVLMRIHKTRSAKHPRLYHLDAYRLNSGAEAGALGLSDIFRERNSIVLVEWAEKIKKIIPKDAIWVKFKHGSEGERLITVKK